VLLDAQGALATPPRGARCVRLAANVKHDGAERSAS